MGGIGSGGTPGHTTRRRFQEAPVSIPANLDVPDELQTDPVAARFWCAHAEALSSADLLSPGDVPSFILLCRVWSKLQEADGKTFNELLSKYKAFACRFGLFPQDRKKMGLAFKHDDKPEFEF